MHAGRPLRLRRRDDGYHLACVVAEDRGDAKGHVRRHRQRLSELEQAPLPIVLWSFGLLSLEQLQQVLDWENNQG